MNLQVTLPTSRGDLVLRDPIMLAAGTFGYAIEYEKIMNLSRLGAITPSSMTLTDRRPNTAKRFYQSDYGFISSFGASNLSCKIFIHGILPHLPYETTPVFIDIEAYDMEELCKLVSILSEVLELAGMEINLNCPYGNFAAPSYWKDEEKLWEMIRRVEAAAGNKILWFKAPTAEYPVQQMVAVVQESGGDAFVSLNAIGGYSVDTETRRLRCGSGGGGGYSGPGVKSYAMMCTYNSSKTARIPVIGGGGIVRARDVLEYIMTEAYAVQIDSASLMRPGFMGQLIEELEELVDKMNIESLDKIRGCTEYM